MDNKDVVLKLSEKLRAARSLDSYKRIQSVLLRVHLGCTSEQIAQLLGLSVSTVNIIHSRWIQEGYDSFEMLQRGGRRRQYLSPTQEKEFLEPFIQRVQEGHMPSIDEIQIAYQAHTKRDIAKSTVYRMLHRNGWNKGEIRHAKARKFGASDRRGALKDRALSFSISG
jgi:transposase